MEHNTSETTLDDALATLKSPAPSELLRRRVIAMAPSGSRYFSGTRLALAATLAVFVAGTAVLHGVREDPRALQPVLVSEFENVEDSLEFDLAIGQGTTEDLPLLNEVMGDESETGEDLEFAELEDNGSSELALLPIE